MLSFTSIFENEAPVVRPTRQEPETWAPVPDSFADRMWGVVWYEDELTSEMRLQSNC